MAVNLEIDLRERVCGAKDMQGILDTIDFSDWGFYADSKEFDRILADLIRKNISEAVRHMLQSFPPQIELESDRVQVGINLGSNWNDGWIYFDASIEGMIDDLIRRSHRNEMEGGDEEKNMLAERLLRCASKLKKAATEIR